MRTYDIAELMTLFRYESGQLIWSVTKGRGLRGARAGTPCNGYRMIVLNGRQISEHRIIFAMIHGRWPEAQVDHINGDRSDNRIENLREATNAQNRRNSKRAASNTSGLKGASFHKASGKWRATIKLESRCHHLGLFSTPEDTHAAYVSAANESFGEFARAA